MIEKKYLVHEGWAGYDCTFCGKSIRQLPVIIVGIVDKFKEGVKEGSIHRGYVHAHRRCARKMGLKEFGDEVEDTEVD